ncbi:Uncharacterised protein [Mycobacteroides abscessus subsp. abscessus]|nr:Uncharacterised protein [Mycobacteroides abscessus subsp. abscessus]
MLSSRSGQPNPAVEDTIVTEPPATRRSKNASVRWRTAKLFTEKTRSAGAVPGIPATLISPS